MNTKEEELIIIGVPNGDVNLFVFSGKTFPGKNGIIWSRVGESMSEAYLDIETTGLSPGHHEITVVGIYLPNSAEHNVIQLVGDNIREEGILDSLNGVDTIYTYNGSRFDLPFIHVRHKVNLAGRFDHCDLMYHCWKNGLYGGLKTVERQLGIYRRLKEINGYEAVRLWWKYINDCDADALATLLEYNREDVVNLKALREMLL